MRERAVACVCVSLATLACGRTGLVAGDESAAADGGGSAVPAGTGGQAGGGGVQSASGGAGGAGGAGATGAAGGQPESVVAYAQSRTHLYAMFDDLNPVSIGELEGCHGDALDIAVDENGTLFVSTPGNLYRVNPTTAQCTFVRHDSYPNALTVVPLDNPTPTALVGFNTTTYVRIDKSTGVQTVLGELGTEEFYSSGDVALHDGRLYLAISGSGCFDCLAEVHRQTGALLRVIGFIGFAKVFGLMSYEGQLYGFTNAGEILTLDVDNGSGSLVNELPIEFWGAARYP